MHHLRPKHIQKDQSIPGMYSAVQIAPSQEALGGRCASIRQGHVNRPGCGLAAAAVQGSAATACQSSAFQGRIIKLDALLIGVMIKA